MNQSLVEELKKQKIKQEQELRKTNEKLALIEAVKKGVTAGMSQRNVLSNKEQVEHFLTSKLSTFITFCVQSGLDHAIITQFDESVFDNDGLEVPVEGEHIIRVGGHIRHLYQRLWDVDHMPIIFRDSLRKTFIMCLPLKRLFKKK